MDEIAEENEFSPYDSAKNLHRKPGKKLSSFAPEPEIVGSPEQKERRISGAKSTNDQSK